jgi:uncharacterized membrane protein
MSRNAEGDVMSRMFTVSRGWAAAAVLAAMMASATLLTTAAVPVQAQGNACVSSCKASHNQCRIATKGNSSCDAQLQSCLQSCIRK